MGAVTGLLSWKEPIAVPSVHWELVWERGKRGDEEMMAKLENKAFSARAARYRIAGKFCGLAVVGETAKLKSAEIYTACMYAWRYCSRPPWGHDWQLCGINAIKNPLVAHLRYINETHTHTGKTTITLVHASQGLISLFACKVTRVWSVCWFLSLWPHPLLLSIANRVPINRVPEPCSISS